MGIQQSINRLSQLSPTDRVTAADIGRHATLLISGVKPFPITPHIKRLDKAIDLFCADHWEHIGSANLASKCRGFSHPGLRSYRMGGRIVLTVFDGEDYVNINGPERASSDDKPGISGIDWDIASATAAIERLTKEFDPACYVPDSSVTCV